MATIQKKDTSKLKHTESRTIGSIQLVLNQATGDDEPIMSFTAGRNNAFEKVLPMTPPAYARAAHGVGSSLGALRNGVHKASQYRFVVLSDDVPKSSDSKATETVTGIHCIPDDNYIQCDFAATLGRPNIAPEDAVVQIYESGEIDVIAYPGSKFTRSVDAFVKALEAITEIDNTTSFTAGGVRYTVSNAFGNEVTFRCHKA